MTCFPYFPFGCFLVKKYHIYIIKILYAVKKRHSFFFIKKDFPDHEYRHP